MSFTSSNPNVTILVAEEQLQTLRLDRLYRSWRQAVQGGALPGKEFLDPARHPYMDGMLLVIDVETCEGDHCRYRYRSAGRHFIEALKVDPSGTYMDQHFDPGVASTGPLVCGLAVQQRRPVYMTAMRHMFEKHYPLEYIVLPLVDGGGQLIDRLVAAQIYPPDAPRLPYGSGSS